MHHWAIFSLPHTKSYSLSSQGDSYFDPFSKLHNLWPCRVIRLSKLKFGLFLVYILQRTLLLWLLCLLLLLFISVANILGLTVILLLLYTYTYAYFSLFGVYGLVHKLIPGESREESQT